ncbi:MAG: ATP-binding protein [Chloroflexota bacterium]
MGELQIFLLGPPEIRLGGAPLTIRSTKARALLFYLAVSARAYERNHLAGLLWPDLPETNARRNLRVALHKLRQTLEGYLLVESRSLAVDTAASIWLDVWILDEAHRTVEQEGLHTLTSDPTPAVLGALRDAVANHRGEFLEGFAVPDAQAYEAWLSAQRERLRLQLVQVHEALATLAETDGNLDEARNHVQAILVIEPWREESHRRLMRLLFQSGRRSEALAQYEICREILAEELQVEPAPETVALYDEVRRAGELRRGKRAVVQHNLPAETTSFVGRRAELAQIAELLADPGCRLLTLAGPGGMGKTRLALQAARRAIDQFADGVFHVPLETVATAEQLPGSIAGAVGLILSPQNDPWEQLLAYLQERQQLLLLDNFEHLVSSAELLSKLLQAAPALKLLITTRETLKLYEEWLVEVQGLAYPAAHDASDLTHAEAAALFLQRARRVDLGFSPEGHEAAVIRICRLLLGMPLGIELAAAWVRTMSPGEIARQISASLDVLETSLRNVPRRHRSMMAVFNHSWQLLRSAEKQHLRRLAVFRGAFSTDAARQVTGAGRRVLHALVDKSLLRLVAEGRFDMHPLIHEFAADKLSEHRQEQRAVEDEHTRYFAAFLNAEESALKGVEQQQALQRIAGEMDNIRVAWDRACAEPALLAQMVTPLFHFLIKRGQQREGFALFEQAIGSLERRAAEGSLSVSPEPLLARLLVRQGRLGEHISRDFEVPEALLSRGLALARENDLPVECAQALQGLGTLALLRGNIDEAATFLTESLEICRRATINDVLAGVLVMFAWLRYAEREMDLAKAMAREALAHHRDSGDITGVASALTALGTVHSDLGEFYLAEDAFEEALTLCRQSGHKVGESQALTGLFNVTYRQGDRERAVDYARQSVVANREAGNRLGTAIAYHNLGATAAGAGRHQEAVEAYEEARAIYQAIKADGARRSNNHLHLAQSLLVLDETAAARRALQAALRALPEQAQSQLAPAVLQTAARLFNQTGDEELAARLVRFLQKQDLLDAAVDLPVAASRVDLEQGQFDKELTSLSEALTVVERRLNVRSR